MLKLLREERWGGISYAPSARDTVLKEGMDGGVEAHYLQLLQVSLWIDMSCCYLINFGMDSRLEELKRNAGVFKLKRRKMGGNFICAQRTRYGPERGNGWGGGGALFTTAASFFMDRHELLLSDKFWNGQQIGRTKEKCWCI
ncbi:hypothetical protein CFP56_016532 [Quercus suber]|uniref:Uncharacterized protein n=1 Tax=Quercus suber TaxID=58331 RepID=A0AAW0M2W7_QUESU